MQGAMLSRGAVGNQPIKPSWSGHSSSPKTLDKVTIKFQLMLYIAKKKTQGQGRSGERSYSVWNGLERLI